MIHDFATVPRQPDWRQAGRQERRKSEPTSKPARIQRRQEPQRAQPEAGHKNSRRAVLPVIAVCVLVFVAKIALSGDEPVADQQPDAAAKKEYAESVLQNEESAVVVNDTESLPVASSESEPQLTESAEMLRETRDAQSASFEQSDESRVQLTQSVEVVKKEADETVAQVEKSDIVPADVTVDPDYEFYDSLKQGSWPVPINKGVYVDGELAERERPVYKLQAASFRSKADAYRLAGKLKNHKLAAVVVPSVSSNGQYWYQVSVGPFVSTTKLNKAQDILVSMNMMPLKKRVQ